MAGLTGTFIKVESREYVVSHQMINIEENTETLILTRAIKNKTNPQPPQNLNDLGYQTISDIDYPKELKEFAWAEIEKRRGEALILATPNKSGLLVEESIIVHNIKYQVALVEFADSSRIWVKTRFLVDLYLLHQEWKNCLHLEK